MNLRQAQRKAAKIKLALQGCLGSGKTLSSLLLASGPDDNLLFRIHTYHV